MWSPLPKTQRRIKTLRHSPCDNTPNAATIDLTTCGVSLLSSNNIDFYFHTAHGGPLPQRYSTCSYSSGGGIGSIVTNTVSTYQIWELATYLLGHMYKSTAISKLSYTPPITTIKVAQCPNAPLSFWQRTPHQKILHIFLVLNAETGFLKFKAKDQPFKCT